MSAIDIKKVIKITQKLIQEKKLVIGDMNRDKPSKLIENSW